MEPDFDALVRNETPDAAVVITAAGKIVHWSKSAESLFGYPSAECLGKQIAELTAPPDRHDQELHFIQRTLDAGHATLETVRRRKDGSLIYVDISGKVIRSFSGSEPLILLTKKDVTELSIERDSMLLNARFDDLLDHLPDGMVVVNLTGHIILANELAGTLFGYAPEDLHGMLVESLMPPRFRGGHVAQRSSYVANPSPRPMGAALELFGLRKDGSEFPIEISLSPINVTDTWLVMTAIRDISERRRVEKALQELSRQNEMLLREMQHRIANSLQIVATILQMKARGVQSEETRRHLEEAHLRVAALVAVQSHLELRHATGTADVEAGRYLTKLCESLGSSMISDEQPLTIRAEADPGYLTSDQAVSVGLMVTELVINALKHAFPAGAAGEVVVRYRSNDSGWSLSVSDNGVGMPGELAAKPARTGLGTTIVGTLAQQLGGQVQTSAGSPGTTVTLTVAKSMGGQMQTADVE